VPVVRGGIQLNDTALSAGTRGDVDEAVALVGSSASEALLIELA
jgi:hypothetical protein